MRPLVFAAIGMLLTLCSYSSAIGQPAAEAPPPLESPQPTEPPAAQPSPPAAQAYQPLIDALRASLGAHAPLALIRPEPIGTERSLRDLEDYLLAGLAQDPPVALIAPDEVERLTEGRFIPTPAGIGQLAKRCQAGSALHLRWIQSDEGLELVLLLVAADATVLLDRVFELAAPPVLEGETPPGPPDAPVAAHQPPDQPEEPAAEEPVAEPAPPAIQPAEEYQRLQLRLAERPGGREGTWVLQGEQPIGELELAQLVGRTDLIDRIQTEMGRLQSWRNLGIGLALGGFAVAGMSTPFFKADEDSLIFGSVVTGAGLAVGAAGLVLWFVYGEQAARAGGPSPVHPLLDSQETEQAVKAYNDRLRRELNLPAEYAPEPVSFYWQLGPTDGGLAGALTLVF